MTMWTNGSTHLIATAQGIARIAGNSGSTVFRFPALPGAKRGDEPPTLEFAAALDEDGTSMIVRRYGETVKRWTHDAKGGRTVPCTGHVAIEQCVATSAGRFVALVPDASTPKRLALHELQIDGEQVTLGAKIELPQPRKLEFKSALFKKGEGWPEDPDEDDEDDVAELKKSFDARDLDVYATASWHGRVSLVSNQWGVGIGTTWGGLVAVLDPKTLAPRLVVRVPCHREQFDVFVLPTRSGALVTLVANYRHTEFVYVDNDGTVGGVRSKFGKDLAWGPGNAGVAYGDDTVLVNHANTEEQVHALTLPGLETKRFDKEPVVLVDSAATANGKVIVIGRSPLNAPSAHNWQIARYERKGAKWDSTEVAPPDMRPAQTPASTSAASAVRRAEGTPALGVVADSSTPWKSAPGSTVTLRMNVGNRGGGAKGIYVEVAGAAVEQGLVTALEVGCDGAPATTFALKSGAARAELSTVAIEPGVLPPLTKGGPSAPQPIRAIEVRLRTEKEGMALMTVRVGPLGASGTAGSGMAGRSFVVGA